VIFKRKIDDKTFLTSRLGLPQRVLLPMMPKALLWNELVDAAIKGRKR